MNRFCTMADQNYLTSVVALDDSRRTWCGELPMEILVLDENISDRLEVLVRSGYVHGVRLWRWTQLVTPEIAAARLNRSWAEWVWTLKSFWILFLMRELKKWEQLTYIDADMYFFGPPGSLFEELESHSIGITPHRFSSSFEPYIVNGEFNGAFVHVKNTQNALSCITHWAGQCLRRCSLVHGEGSFGDQKYLNAWPKRWRAHSIQHPGVNLAPWNQGESHYEYGLQDGKIMVDGEPLILYHFHEGMLTHYPLDPFIKEHVYGKWKRALDDAQRIVNRCTS